MRLLAASHYLHPVREGEALPSLDERLAKVSREKFRRIDRFIQLALLGSGECVAGRALRPDCALYLASGIGPAGNNIAVQEQLIRDHKLPKPFNFVNTLGSASGYYVAKNLGLSGQSLFLSRRGAALPAALAAAAADLDCGAVTQALVGIVEEVSFPLRLHRRRQGLGPEPVLAEGTDWLLLEAGEGQGRRLTLTRYEELEELLSGLKGVWNAGSRLRLGREVDAASAAQLRQLGPELAQIAAFHDSQDAAQLGLALASGRAGVLVYVAGSPAQGWVCLRVD